MNTPHTTPNGTVVADATTALALTLLRDGDLPDTEIRNRTGLDYPALYAAAAAAGISGPHGTPEGAQSHLASKTPFCHDCEPFAGRAQSRARAWERKAPAATVHERGRRQAGRRAQTAAA